MFRTKVVDKIKTHILCSVTFFQKSCHLWDNVEKYGTARQVTDDNIIRYRKYARIEMHTHIIYYLLHFHGNSSYVNAPQCYLIHTLPVLLPCSLWIMWLLPSCFCFYHCLLSCKFCSACLMYFMQLRMTWLYILLRLYVFDIFYILWVV
jgi:hypothetical protein